MAKVTRRSFMGQSLAAAGAVAAASRMGLAQAAGANEKIRVAIAGLNGRGYAHTEGFLALPNVEIACLVDPDTRTFAGHVKKIEDKTGRKPECVQDIRRVLEDKNIQAISIATPNHWHTLMSIWACQAGKDVYVEKPLSHNLREGRALVQAAEKYGRIVQHGTQMRSEQPRRRAMAAAKAGKFGKLLIARGFCWRPRESVGFKPLSLPPKEVDYNLWLGPAPELPFHENLVHYNWHWFWETGCGEIGNQGVHQMDIGRWGLGGTLPRRVVSLGGRFGYSDQAETPNTQISIMDFDGVPFIFEVRGLPTEHKVVNVFEFEAGTLSETKFFPKGSKEAVELPDVEVKSGPGGGDHFANFIAAMGSRKREDLNADVLEGHYSSSLCHLSNVSYRLGQKIPFESSKGLFEGSEWAAKAVEAMNEHLGGANKLDLKTNGLVYGRELVIDAKSETVVNDPEGNALLGRYYRRGFELPEKV